MLCLAIMILTDVYLTQIVQLAVMLTMHPVFVWQSVQNTLILMGIIQQRDVYQLAQ